MAKGLAFIERTQERYYEAELYRIKGELLLVKAREQATGKGQRKGKNQKSKIKRQKQQPIPDPRPPSPNAQGEGALPVHA